MRIDVGFAEINGSFRLGSAATEFLCGSDNAALEFLRARNSDGQYHNLIASATGIKFESDNGGTRKTLWEAATKGDLNALYYMSSSMTNSGLIDLVGTLRYRHIYISSSYTGTFEVPEDKTIAYYGTVFTSAVNGYGLIVLFGSSHVYTQEIANSNAMDWVRLA